MFTKMLKKLIAKISVFTLLFGLMAPLQTAVASDNGTIDVNVSPNEAQYQILDVLGNNYYGDGVTFQGSDHNHDVPAGPYTVKFLPLNGYVLPFSNNVIPGEEEINVSADGLITVNGVYIEESSPNGIIDINVSPEEAEYEILNAMEIITMVMV